MNTIIKTLISVIGLKQLLSFVWTIAYEELLPLTKESKTNIDDKALEFINKIIQDTIANLP